MSLFTQFFYLLSSFILFILLFQLACPPLSARLLVKNTNKGEKATQFFYPLSYFILFVGEEHQQRRRICYVFVHSIFLSAILFHLVYPPLSACLSSSFSSFVGEEHQQRREYVMSLFTQFFIRYPL